MQQDRFRKWVAGLLIALCIVGGVLLVLQFRARADLRAGGAASSGFSPGHRARQAVAATTPGPAPSTVYLPWTPRDVRPAPSVFGVQMRAVTNGQGLAQAVAARMQWVRLTAFQWDEIEPVRTSPPTYDWSVVDEQSLLNAEAHGLEFIATIHGTPDWAQAVPGAYCGPIKPEALDEFAQFVTELVSRYRGAPYNVRYWELGNEPDVDPSLVNPDSPFGCWGDEGDPYYGGGYYAEMLKVAYPAIKAVDPHAQVLLGGLLLDCDPGDPPPGKDCASGRFLEGILRAGGGDAFDVVSFHAYTYFDEASGQMGNPSWSGSGTAMPEKLAFLQAVLDQFGYGHKALMNTEAALLCFENTAVCLEAQARYVPRAYAEALALDLQAQIYYAMINEGWRYTGLLLPDLTPKPAYNAYTTTTSFLSEVEYRGAATGYPAGVAGYSFHENGAPWHVDVVWSADGSPQSVTLPAGASAYDHYGALINTGGIISVGGGPVYVRRPSP